MKILKIIILITLINSYVMGTTNEIKVLNLIACASEKCSIKVTNKLVNQKINFSIRDKKTSKYEWKLFYSVIEKDWNYIQKVYPNSFFSNIEEKFKDDKFKFKYTQEKKKKDTKIKKIEVNKFKNININKENVKTYEEILKDIKEMRKRVNKMLNEEI